MKKLFKKISIPIPKFRLCVIVIRKKNFNPKISRCNKNLLINPPREVFFCENYNILKIKNRSLLETKKKVLQVKNI